ncbi:hypothetical protein BH24ACT7_BH24ACT7_26470 [soil metagenome]
MRIAVLRTGPVGQSFAARLDELGHQVTVGTRDVSATIARTEPDSFGRPPFPEWAREHSSVGLASLPDAAERAELVMNAGNGAGSPFRGPRVRELHSSSKSCPCQS